MCDREGCTTGRGIPLGVPRDRFLALEGEGITWMGQPSRQGIALFSVRIEFWTPLGFRRQFRQVLEVFSNCAAVTLGYAVGTRVTMSMGGPGYQAMTHRNTHGTVAAFGAGAAAGCAAGRGAQQMRLLLDYSA